VINRCKSCGTVEGEDHREPVGKITYGICHECAVAIVAEYVTGRGAEKVRRSEEALNGETPATAATS